MIAAKGFQQSREHIEADGHAADQPERAAHRLLTLENAGARPIEILEHPLAQAQQRGSRRRDANLPTETQEQLLVQLFFEQAGFAG